MNRRDTLAKLLGQSSKTATTVEAAITGLVPFAGTFDYEKAAHLLRRATFGATYQQVKNAVTSGLDATIATLFEPKPMPEPPLNPAFTDDPYVGIGETWVNSPADVSVPGLTGYRVESLRAWTLDLIRTEGLSIREKMVLFWHNHFPIADIQDQRYVYNYITLIRENALGNFREFTKAMAIEPAMLRYLNGNDNTAVSPNENFAREVMELFTIGKGPLVGPGDYTNYTEQDVVEMAKVFTGWVDRGFGTQDPSQQIEAQFKPLRHNTTTKQLSYRFNNVQIPNMGDQEYTHLIDIIFMQDECARFICRKLYRWFVYYEISQQVEDEVIAPMAQILIDNDYEIKPALEALLRSEHFFDILSIGPMIKNPVDFTMGIFKIFEVDFANASPEELYKVLYQVFRTTVTPMQMAHFDPPSVAGWKAYYQEPVFYRNWISAVTLPLRQNLSNLMLGNGFTYNGFKARIRVLPFIQTLEVPEVADNLIEELVKVLFPQPITPSQHDYLKDILLAGQPDFEWTVEYNNYLANPNDLNQANAIKQKLTALLTAMMSMPEFYLS